MAPFIITRKRILFLFLFLSMACFFLSSCTQETGSENRANSKPHINEKAGPGTEPYQDMKASPLTPSEVSEKVPQKARELVEALLGEEGKKQNWDALPGGVFYHDIFKGDGKPVKHGSAIHMKLRGFLKNGAEFVNTNKHPHNKSYVFTYGIGEVVKGFEMGVATMKEKGKRVIVIPPELGFKEKGYRSPYVFIPPYSTLIYEASFMFRKDPEWNKIDLFK